MGTKLYDISIMYSAGKSGNKFWLLYLNFNILSQSSEKMLIWILQRNWFETPDTFEEVVSFSWYWIAMAFETYRKCVYLY